MYSKESMSKKKVEIDRDQVLSAAKHEFNLFVKTYGINLACWAFRRLLELESKKSSISKRKKELESQLKDVSAKLATL